MKWHIARNCECYSLLSIGLTTTYRKAEISFVQLYGNRKKRFLQQLFHFGRTYLAPGQNPGVWHLCNISMSELRKTLLCMWSFDPEISYKYICELDCFYALRHHQSLRVSATLSLSAYFMISFLSILMSIHFIFYFL